MGLVFRSEDNVSLSFDAFVEEGVAALGKRANKDVEFILLFCRKYI